MRRTLTDGDFGTEFWQQLANYQHDAWRWENQPLYAITDEQASVDAFLAGRPSDPMEDPYLAPWMHQVARQRKDGKSIGRVRVLEEPPTDYQRWERWLDRWNSAAGEDIRYLTRSQARELGTSPFGGDTDWWLFDDARVMILHFDETGFRCGVELSDNSTDVATAVAWRRRAVSLAPLATRERGDATREPDRSRAA